MDSNSGRPGANAARRAGTALAVALSLMAALAAACLPARAAELVMFERSGCIWCLRWDREVAAIYPKTPEGAKAPLRRISLDRPVPGDLKLQPPVFYTPTFVLLDEGREVGRITGYLGDDAFWGLLTQMIGKLEASKK